jgi:hypothetical protein
MFVAASGVGVKRQLGRPSPGDGDRPRCGVCRSNTGGKAKLSGSAWGGGARRHQNLPVGKEAKLLAGFLERAERGGLLEVSRVQQAYEQAVAMPCRIRRFTACWPATAGVS